MMDPSVLIGIVTHKMPYGKYEGRYLCDLPVSYLEWFDRKQAFPQGKLGMELRTLLEIKRNGLDHLLTPIKNKVR